MVIRSYSESDIQHLVGLFTASIHALGAAHYDADQLAAWAPATPDLGEWVERLNGLETVVAEDGGTIAGFVSYEPDGHIDLLYTSPDHARKGVASSLYRHVELLLSSSGAAEIYTEASLVARPFFERHGFRVEEEQIVARRGIEFRRFFMRKRLCADGSK